MQWDGSILYGTVAREHDLGLWLGQFRESEAPLVLVVDVRHPPLPLDELTAVLSHDERRRIQRLELWEDRRRARVSRGLLRVVLGRLTGCPADKLPLVYGEHGKPHLTPPALLQFSVSHSGDYLMLAFAQERSIGVDVEQIRPLSDFESLLRYCLTGHEQRELELVSGKASRQLAFFSAWTQKEALLKAMGCGLSLMPSAVGISMQPQNNPRLLHVDGQAEAPTEWKLIALPSIEGYASALAIKQRPAS